MLAARYAIRLGDNQSDVKPGLRRLVLVSPPVDMPLWVKCQNELRAKLPEDVQSVLKKHEDEGTTNSMEYNAALGAYYGRHLCNVNPMPPDLLASFGWIREDPTVTQTMLGLSDFACSGSLRNWSIVNEVHKINVPTLLLNGRHDKAQDSVIAPYFWNVPKIKWFTLPNSSHMPHLEEPELFEEVVKDFLFA
ncbi:hypothetical protein AX16_006514 [Volvariella volvacea WC 439]|nr:hypothetical protein AX16_006514 [Volvariella volvacea WC 439]